MHTNLVWVLDVQSYLCSMLPRSSHPKHDAVFDNKHMKLFDARPNVICIFGLRIKQFLIASNIEFSDILETLSYFVITLVYQTVEHCAGSGASEGRA